MPIFANVLQPLIDVFEWVLVNILHDGIGLSWGWSIVGLTIVVRAVLLPLAIRQYKSMKRCSATSLSFRRSARSTGTTRSASTRR